MNGPRNNPKSQTAAPFPKKGRLRWLRRAKLIVLAVIAALILLGAGYQAAASAADSRRYPPPGKLVDIGGYRLHICCTGIGSPTVILDSGAAGPAEMWGMVQPELARTNRVCSYDRAGLGWSDASPKVRTSQEMVAELHALLVNAGVEPPYILVGHSLGGFNVRLYASLYPTEVAGIVLVNAAYDFPPAALSPGCQKILKTNTSFARIMRPLTVLGLTRLADELGFFSSIKQQVLAGMDEKLLAELTALTFYRPQYWATYTAELSSAGEDALQANAAGSLGATPLVVLSGKPDVGRIPPETGCSAQELIEMDKADQVKLVALSADSTHIVCDECGHYIPMTNPEQAVNAVRHLLAEVQP